MIITFVSIGPGAIQLNLIPYLPHSAASDLQNILDLYFFNFIHSYIYCYLILFFALEIHDFDSKRSVFIFMAAHYTF